MDTGKGTTIYSAFVPVRPRVIRWLRSMQPGLGSTDRSKNDTHLVVVTPLSKRKRICVEHPRFAFFGFNHDVVLPSADSRYTEVRGSVKLLQMNNTVTFNRSAMLPATGILPAPLACVYVNVCDSHISGHLRI